MNWNDGSEDIAKIWQLEKRIVQLEAEKAALEAQVAQFKTFLTACGEMESFRDTLPKESPHEE